MADVVYVAQLDDSQVLKALQNIDKNIDKLAKDASREFENIGKAAKQSGVNIGVMSGIVSSLTTEFINLGKQAISTLIEIGKQSVQTAIEMDTLKARLGGIFDGSEQAADQAFTFIQQKSKELGFDLSELAGAFIPKTENLAQFERVAKIATALARSDPEQGAIGARIALIEALSGTFTSLQRRFEIGKIDTQRIKEAFETGGTEGFLTELEEVLKEGGRSFDDFNRAATTSFAKVQLAGEQLGGRLGAPIVESLQEAAEKILDFINTNEDELIVFADTIGRAIGDAIDFLASIDLSQLDTSQLIEVADTIYAIVNAITLVVPQVATFVSGFASLASNLPVVSQTLDGLAYILNGLDEAFITLVQIIGLANAELAAFSASSEKAAIGIDLVQAGLSAASLNYVDVIKQLQEAQEKTTSGVDSQKAYNDAIAQSAKGLEDFKSALDGNKDSQDKLRDTLKEEAAAGTDAADAILELAAAQKEGEQAADDFEAAQAKVNEKMAEAKKDFDRKLEDIDIQTERKRLDIAIEFGQKREDAAIDNLRKLADIQEKYDDDTEDAATDLERKRQDIATKYYRDYIDIEREQRQKRVDIEKDFNREIKDIQSQFLLDAQEAEEKRDAVAFIRAIKERDKKVQEAQTDRQRTIKDAKTTADEKRHELIIQFQREQEDAQLAYDRKLEDLKTNLDRQREEQNENYEQQLSDLVTAEQRKNEELTLWREREIEDANTAYARKLEDLRTALAAELAVIEEYAAKRAEIEARIAASEAKIQTSTRPSTTGGASAGFGVNPSTLSTSVSKPKPTLSLGFSSIRSGRASGGNVFAGGTYPVGERGMELFTPNQDGRIIPNSVLTMPNFGSGGGMTNITNNNSKSASLGGLLDANSLDAILASKVENILLRVLDKMS